MPTRTAHPNDAYRADIVIQPEIGGFSVWQHNKVIANVSPAGADLIAAGASASKLSVYDTTAKQFLTGTLDQLINQSKEA